MPTKRAMNSRTDAPAITEEMLALFARGLELQAEGHDSVVDKSPRHAEFIKIRK
jgi:hypothetical protein